MLARWDGDRFRAASRIWRNVQINRRENRNAFVYHGEAPGDGTNSFVTYKFRFHVQLIPNIKSRCFI